MRADFTRTMWTLADDVLHGNWANLDTLPPDVVEELQALFPPTRHSTAYHLRKGARVMQRRMALVEHRPLSVVPAPDGNIWGYVKIDQRLTAHHLLTDADGFTIGSPRIVVAQNPKHRDALWKRLLMLDLKRLCAQGGVRSLHFRLHRDGRSRNVHPARRRRHEPPP